MVLRDSAKSTGYGFYYSFGLLILVILLAPKIVPYGYADIVKGAQNLGPFQYSDAEQAQIDAGEKLFPHILAQMSSEETILSVLFTELVYHWE